MRRTVKGAVAATALMLALSSPVFAEVGVSSTKDRNDKSAYTGTGVNNGMRADNMTNVYTNRVNGTENPAPVANTTRNNFRRYNVNADNNGFDNNGLLDRTGRSVRNTVRAAATDADNDFDWGWLGLLGLIGLAGMRGRMRQT